MEVEEEFAPTSRPTLRYSEPELAEQTQVPRNWRIATLAPNVGLERMIDKVLTVMLECQ